MWQSTIVVLHVVSDVAMACLRRALPDGIGSQEVAMFCSAGTLGLLKLA